MRCPVCNSTKTKVIDSRPKEWNDLRKTIDVTDVPTKIKAMDYRLRRHKCKKCNYIFPTIETYFRKDDIKILHDSQKIQVL